MKGPKTAPQTKTQFENKEYSIFCEITDLMLSTKFAEQSETDAKKLKTKTQTES